MRNGHVVFRQLLSAFALGATIFRSDNTIPRDNPLFLRHTTNVSAPFPSFVWAALTEIHLYVTPVPAKKH